MPPSSCAERPAMCGRSTSSSTRPPTAGAEAAQHRRRVHARIDRDAGRALDRRRPSHWDQIRPGVLTRSNGRHPGACGPLTLGCGVSETSVVSTSEASSPPRTGRASDEHRPSDDEQRNHAVEASVATGASDGSRGCGRQRLADFRACRLRDDPIAQLGASSSRRTRATQRCAGPQQMKTSAGDHQPMFELSARPPNPQPARLRLLLSGWSSG